MCKGIDMGDYSVCMTVTTFFLWRYLHRWSLAPNNWAGHTTWPQRNTFHLSENELHRAGISWGLGDHVESSS